MSPPGDGKIVQICSQFFIVDASRFEFIWHKVGAVGAVIDRA
jgi:hypothetical protein